MRPRAQGARRPVAVPWALAVLAVLPGCGLPAEDRPRALETSEIRPVPSAAPVPSPSAAPPAAGPEQVLCLTRDERLVPVARRVAAAPRLQDTVEDLLAGPTHEESAEGLVTALGGTPVVSRVRLEEGVAVVTLREDVVETSRNDDLLAIGQVVCTLSARDDVRGVVFQRAGERVAVPRGDGSLARGPLRTADYAVLLTPPPPG